MLHVSDKIGVGAIRILAKNFLLGSIAEAVIFGDRKGYVEEGIARATVPMNNADFKECHADGLRRVSFGWVAHRLWVMQVMPGRVDDCQVQISTVVFMMMALVREHYHDDVGR